MKIKIPRWVVIAVTLVGVPFQVAYDCALHFWRGAIADDSSAHPLEWISVILLAVVVAGTASSALGWWTLR
jgi:hypothetical protein